MKKSNTWLTGGLVATCLAFTGCKVDAPDTGTVYFLKAAINQIWKMNSDGTDSVMIISNARTPDGIAVDQDDGWLYWTNMGSKTGSSDNGSISCSDADGDNVVDLVPLGGTFTPKQITFVEDVDSDYIYWSDREGKRVMRAKVDGCNNLGVDVLVDNRDRGNEYNPVGIAVDLDGGYFYWTQKDSGEVLRAPLDSNFPISDGVKEVIYSNIDEPIDLDLDVENSHIYWTTRGDNRVYRGQLDGSAEITLIGEGATDLIGVALDLENDEIYFSDMGGTLYRDSLIPGGSEPHKLTVGVPFISLTAFSGVAFVPHD